MGKKEKALARFLSKPKDFAYRELITLLSYFGYTEKSSGEGAKFIRDGDKKVLYLHPPHGEDQQNALKQYQIKDIIKALKENGDI